MKKRLAFIALIALGVLVLILGVGFLLLNKPLPKGTPGKEADALANRVLDAVNRAGWKATGAIKWNFWGQYDHIWDRQRWFAQVSWGSGSGRVVAQLLLLEPTKGVVKRGGKEVTGDERAALLRKAYALWCNDSYWLNPFEKFFDNGVTRSIVERDGKKMLLISFSSGGVTPGDSYLYEIGKDGLPTRWWMWVSMIPVGGVEASFEGWKQLATGAKTSAIHKMIIGTLTLNDIQAATDATTLNGGKDPFTLLQARFPGI
jgi:hypothetical protein